VVDRAFQENIWALLTKHPNVSVGRDRSFNGLPLSDIESTYAGVSECVTVTTYRETESPGPIRDDRVAAPVVPETRAVSEDAVAGSETNARFSEPTLDRVVADSSEHDGVGFPQRHQPRLQNRNGQTRFTGALNSAKPSDFMPSAGDLVAGEKVRKSRRKTTTTAMPAAVLASYFAVMAAQTYSMVLVLTHLSIRIIYQMINGTVRDVR
jgi:hypothetical protein